MFFIFHSLFLKFIGERRYQNVVSEHINSSLLEIFSHGMGIMGFYYLLYNQNNIFSYPQ